MHVWEDSGARIAASATDESGKIDLNTAPDTLLKGLLQTAGGLDADSAARLVDAIGDWKDADELRRPNGAEAPEYQAAGLELHAGELVFETVPELQRVLGMSPALYAKLADSLTVYSRLAGINPAFASRATLLAVPGATAEIVDTYLPAATRRDGGQSAGAAVSGAGCGRRHDQPLADSHRGDDERRREFCQGSGHPSRRRAPAADGSWSGARVMAADRS